MADILELTQRDSFFGKIHLTVDSKAGLTQAVRSLFRSSQHTYALEEIDPVPVYQRRIAVGWWLGALFFLLLIGAGLYEWIKDGTLETQNWLPLVVLIGIFVVLLINAIRLSRNVYLFRSSKTRAPLFSICRNLPSTAEVDGFVSALRSVVEAFRTPQGLTPLQMAHYFQKVLDDLLDNGVLESGEHQAATRRNSDRMATQRNYDRPGD